MKLKNSTLVKIINNYNSKTVINAIHNFIPAPSNNVDTIDQREKVTPLVAAVSVGNPEILKALLSLGPDMKKKENECALTEIIESVNYHANLPEDKFSPSPKKVVMAELQEIAWLLFKYNFLFY